MISNKSTSKVADSEPIVSNFVPSVPVQNQTQTNTDDFLHTHELPAVRSFMDMGESCWILPLIVSGTRLEFLIDSGATKSLDVDSFKMCFPGRLDDLHQPHMNMWAANDTTIDIYGEGEITLEVGQKKFPIMVAVAKLGNLDGILGMDFLKRRGMQLDLGEGLLKVDGWSVCLTDRVKRAVKCSRLRACEDIVIPSRHEITLGGFVDQRRGTDPWNFGVIDPVTSFVTDTGLLVAKSIVSPNQNANIPVTLLNIGDEEVLVKRGTTIAIVSPVDGFGEIKGDLVLPCTSDTTEFPEHLQPLLDQVSESLSDVQIQQLRALILNYTSIFVGPDGELGHTDITKHRIDTGSAKPVKLPPRRFGPVERDIIDNEVDKMMSKGIIEPSNSPWASPVVLAQKKDGSTRFCIDYRRCNELTRKDAYPLPRIDESVDALSGSQ